MTPQVRIGERLVGEGQPAYVVAEIGINHNGEIDIAKRLADAARAAGCDAVKVQKRTPELCVPIDQQTVERDTPWGRMTYLEYRERLELDVEAYAALDRHCRELGIDLFASPWDEPSVDFLEAFSPVAHKVASASITDMGLLRRLAATGRPIIISTGMSTWGEIVRAVETLGSSPIVICHSTSAYPCPPSELNLSMIATLRDAFDHPIGYSGHEVGLQTTVAAVALGACYVERHITLDRASWGTDQAASVEPPGFERLVRDIRVVEAAMGDGVKQVYESEQGPRAKLRRFA